ncbi:hypothetical protein [Clostridium ihumii]|nr:hypothetical protein [Clostridium ihumii]
MNRLLDFNKKLVLHIKNHDKNKDKNLLNIECILFEAQTFE